MKRFAINQLCATANHMISGIAVFGWLAVSMSAMGVSDLLD